jgi:hypothetical protein
VDLIVGVRDVLGTMQTTSALFNTFTNFTLRNLTSWLLEWSLPLKPTLDPHVSFFFHILCFQFWFLGFRVKVLGLNFWVLG